MMWLRKNTSTYSLLSLLFITLVIIVFFIPLFYPHPSFFINPEFNQSDVTHFNIPVKFFLSESLKNNQLPLWSKNIDTGFPLFAESQIGALYLPNLILFKILPFWMAFNLEYVFAFLIAGWGMFFLLKHVSYRNLICIFGSLVFAFSGFFIGHINHLNMIQAASLVPFVIIVADKLHKNFSLKLFLIFIFLLSQQIFSGHMQIAFITGLLLTLLTFEDLIKKQYTSFWRRNILIVVGFIMAFIMSAIQILPSLELHKLSIRSGPYPVDAVTYFSSHPLHLLTLINPFILGKTSNATYQFMKNMSGNIFWESNMYLGLTSFILLMASFAYIKHKRVRFLWVLEIIWILLFLGKYSPLYIIYTIPPFSFFTTPARFILPFIIIAVMIISDSLSKISMKFKTSQHKMQFILIGVTVFFIADVFFFWFTFNPAIDKDIWLKKPKIVEKVISNKSEGRILSLEIKRSWEKYFTSEGWRQTAPYVYYKNESKPNTNLLWNISHFDAYVGRITTKRKSFYNEGIYSDIYAFDKNILVGSYSAKLMSISNIEYITSDTRVEPSSQFKQIEIVKKPEQKEHFSDYLLYKNISVAPRAHFADSVFTAATLTDFKNIVTSPSFDPNHEVVLEDQVKIDGGTSKNDSIKWIKDVDQEVVLSIQSSKKQLLVLADLYFPGWKAYVNNQKILIYPANIIQRAIIVPKGKSTVVFKYEPDSYNNGKLISVVSYGIIICLFLLLSYFGIRRSSSSRNEPASHP